MRALEDRLKAWQALPFPDGVVMASAPMEILVDKPVASVEPLPIVEGEPAMIPQPHFIFQSSQTISS